MDFLTIVLIFGMAYILSIETFNTFNSEIYINAVTKLDSQIDTITENMNEAELEEFIEKNKEDLKYGTKCMIQEFLIFLYLFIGNAIFYRMSILLIVSHLFRDILMKKSKRHKKGIVILFSLIPQLAIIGVLIFLLVQKYILT